VAGKIEDYALVGDCHSAALVGRNGSVDWLCWPRFDSAACFAALLGTADNGRWLITPADPITQTTRAYLDQTLVLETRFSTATGEVSIIDFMTPRDDCANLIRLVVGRSGQVPMRMELALRFDYGATMPWVEKLPDDSGISAIAGPDRVILRTPAAIRGEDFRTVADFSVQAGETIPFVLTHSASHLPLTPPFDVAAAKDLTMSFWHGWSSQSTYHGPWQETVMRSLITLKALTYAPTGGMIAAPTTSLPEKINGVRNWDYRYCWVRDATLTLLALMHTGYYEEAESWRSWLLRAVAGNPAQMQIMYGIAGERRLPELTLDWLPGYENSAPVRIGNGAAGQLQLDVYGEMMDALYQGRHGKLQENGTVWLLQVALIEHLAEIWQEPDDGIWESRGGRQQFTLSKVMAWVAFDRAIRTIKEGGMSCPVDRWVELRQRIHDDVCRHGFDPQQNSFTQIYNHPELDASLLLLPLVGFLPPEDPRIIGTVEAIQRKLTVDGFVLRYDTNRSDDGLPANEGVFLACSFWLADNLVLQGKLEEAQQIFERLLSLCNDVGLLAEEYDPRDRRFVGNFPQAFSHIALINTALNLNRAVNPAKQRSGEPGSSDRPAS